MQGLADQLAEIERQRDQLRIDVDTMQTNYNALYAERAEQVADLNGKLAAEREKVSWLTSERDRLNDDLAAARSAQVSAEGITAEFRATLMLIGASANNVTAPQPHRDAAVDARTSEAGKEAFARLVPESAPAASAESAQPLPAPRERMVA